MHIYFSKNKINEGKLVSSNATSPNKDGFIPTQDHDKGRDQSLLRSFHPVAGCEDHNSTLEVAYWTQCPLCCARLTACSGRVSSLAVQGRHPLH